MAGQDRLLAALRASGAVALLGLAALAQQGVRPPGGGAGARLSGAPDTIEGPGTVVSGFKISSERGGLEDTLDAGDSFGSALAALGDLDGDGIEDLAVGSPGDESGPGAESTGNSRGAVWVLYLRADGTPREHVKISATEGGFRGELGLGCAFGAALAPLGDLDGDGVIDLAVGAPGDTDGGGGAARGAVWLLFLRPDGTVKAQAKISATAGGFGGPLDPGDGFGSALATPGDLDGDGVVELVVGAPFDDDGGPGDADSGAAWLLFLRADGTVREYGKLSDFFGLGGLLDPDDRFGSAAAGLGDLDGDGVGDIAVGAPGDEEAADFSSRGAAWVLFLRRDGRVRAHQKISSTQGGFTDPGYAALFGSALAPLGDLDGDGATELAVGAPQDDWDERGAAWILFLNADGTVRSHRKHGASTGSLAGALSYSAHFGSALAALGDLDGDGAPELGAGAPQDGEGGNATGSAFVLSLDLAGALLSAREIDRVLPGFGGTLDDGHQFGNAVVALGDVDGDGIGDLAVGAARGESVWILFANPDGTVKGHRQIGGGAYASSPGQDAFGKSLAALGDLDGDGVPDLAVGAPTPGYSADDVWIGEVVVLFLQRDGNARVFQRIGSNQGGFTGFLEQYDFFGSALAPLGDLDGDGVLDLAVGSTSTVWVLFLRPDGTVRSLRENSFERIGYDPGGYSLTALGDLDGDGVADLASGKAAPRGALEILFLRADGSIRAHQEIGQAAGGFRERWTTSIRSAPPWRRWATSTRTASPTSRSGPRATTTVPWLRATRWATWERCGSCSSSARARSRRTRRSA